MPKPNKGVQLLYINLSKGGVLNNFTIKIKIKLNKTVLPFLLVNKFYFFFLTGLAGSTYTKAGPYSCIQSNSVPRKGKKKSKDCFSEVDTGAL